MFPSSHSVAHNVVGRLSWCVQQRVVLYLHLRPMQPRAKALQTANVVSYNKQTHGNQSWCWVFGFGVRYAEFSHAVNKVKVCLYVRYNGIKKTERVSSCVAQRTSPSTSAESTESTNFCTISVDVPTTWFPRSTLQKPKIAVYVNH